MSWFSISSINISSYLYARNFIFTLSSLDQLIMLFRFEVSWYICLRSSAYLFFMLDFKFVPCFSLCHLYHSYPQCKTRLTLWVRIPRRRVYSIQHYVIKFVSDSRQPVLSIDKNDRHDKTEILLKVTLNMHWLHR
jgi:hypothetical protein